MNIEIKNKFTLNQRLTVRTLVQGLPEVEQHVIYMRFWDSWAMYEIAAFLEMSVSEVERVLKRALKRLRARCLMAKAFEVPQLIAA